MAEARIDIPTSAIPGFCERNGIRRLALFGSVLREDFGTASDVDVLVEFQPGTRVGLRLFDTQRELSNLIGRNVDLSTSGFLSRHFRDTVLKEAQNLYVAP